MKGFQKFIMRGNLIDLAVAVVIGSAFTAMVTAIVSDIITPLIAAVGGKPNFGGLSFTIHNSHFMYGLLINAVVSFLIVAAVVYFLIVAPVAKLTSRLTRHKEATERDCPECLSSIPVGATRCMYCTSQVAPLTPPIPPGPQMPQTQMPPAPPMPQTHTQMPPASPMRQSPPAPQPTWTPQPPQTPRNPRAPW